MSRSMQFLMGIVLCYLCLMIAVSPLVHATPATTETAQLTAVDASAAAHFGLSVAAEGDTAVIGAPGDAGNVGAAYIFTRSGGAWAEAAKLVAADGEVGDLFGTAVAIQGNTILVGAKGDDDAGANAGAAYIYTNDGSGWAETAKLLPGELGDTHFGFTLSLDGDTIAVGAPYTDSGTTNSGAAYLFEDNGGGWAQTARLATGGGGPVLSDLFGWSVALSGDLLLVGAPLDDVVYAFARDGGGWSETAVLSGDSTQSGDRFGFAVTTDGSRILIGAPQDDDAGSNAGAAFLFVPDGGGWQQEARLLPTGAPPLFGSAFGRSVALWADTAVVGAPNSKGVVDAEESGVAYLYRFDGVNWLELDMLTASDAAEFDHLGTAVALSMAGVLAGAPDSDAAGDDAGAVYYFALDSAPPPPPGGVQSCLAEEQSSEEVLPGITLTWDSALRCLDAPMQGQYAFTVTMMADAGNSTAVVIDDIALTHTTPRPLGQPPVADIDVVTGLTMTLAAGDSDSFSVEGSYEMVTTGEGQKANLHFCASGYDETTGEPFFLGLNAFLRGPGAEEDGDGPPPPPPAISQINVTPGPLGAIITWHTDNPATSEVIYYAVDNPGAVMSITQGCMAATQHTIQLRHLLPGTEYRFRVQSRIGEGAVTTSGELNFTTTQLSERLYLPLVYR